MQTRVHTPDLPHSTLGVSGVPTKPSRLPADFERNSVCSWWKRLFKISQIQVIVCVHWINFSRNMFLFYILQVCFFILLDLCFAELRWKVNPHKNKNLHYSTKTNKFLVNIIKITFQLADLDLVTDWRSWWARTNRNGTKWVKIQRNGVQCDINNHNQSIDK